MTTKSPNEEMLELSERLAKNHTKLTTPPKEVSNGKVYAPTSGQFGALPNPSETNGLKKQIKDILDEASNANVGSETNEAPVESVSQPKAVDGYLKEFDKRFSGEWWNGFGTTEDINKLGIEAIREFIKSSIERARREGVESGRKEMDKEWSKVNKYERQRVVEMIAKLKPRGFGFDKASMDMGYHQALVDSISLISDLQSKLGGTK
jgi:hypothetical protein